MTVGIICAMEKEMKRYQEMFQFRKTDEDFDIFEGYDSSSNNKIILCLSGIGKVNASITTQYLIDHYHPNYIINSGCSGSLVEYVKVLDTILVDFACYHDFTPIRIMESCVPDNGKIMVDSTLFQIATDVLQEQKITYHIGGITSGDCFVTSSTMRDDIYHRTDCLTVDMESASIAHTARKNKVPFLILRSISDFADGVEEQEEKAANISAMVVKEILLKIF